MAIHLLLADDSPSVHRLVTDSLEPEGIHVTCVENGEEALRQAVALIPAIVLADISMPRMGGQELAARLRLEPRARNIPVVLLVGPFDEYDPSRARAQGVVGMIPKPLNPVRLAAVVQDTLARHTRVQVELVDEEELEATMLEQASELPEPEGLAALSLGLPSERMATPSEEATSQLEVVDDDDASDEQPMLPPSRPQLSAEQPQHEGPREQPLTPQRLQAALEVVVTPELIRQTLREMIRDEVRRLLPDIMREVIQQRVAELEAEAKRIERGER